MSLTRQSGGVQHQRGFACVATLACPGSSGYDLSKYDLSKYDLTKCWDRDLKASGAVVLLAAMGNWTDIGECKWGSVRSPKALEDELGGKAGLYRNSRGATLNRRYFVRNKPASRADADGWYSLEDLYALA